MIRTYKYRIYPTRCQVAKLEATLAVCCELYNAALQERRDAYRRAGKSVLYVEQQNQLPEIRACREDLAAVHSQVLQDVLHRVQKAFDGFFRRVKAGQRPGYPRFRSRPRYDSFTYSQSGFAIEGGRLRLSKIGSIKIKLHRPIEGQVKTLTIRRSRTGKWYACFSVELETKPLPPNERVIGVDCGLENFATLSTGEALPNPRFFREGEKTVARAQRKLSKARKGTPGHAKARKAVAHIHERIANRRHSFAHQSSAWLVAHFGTIVFEKLAIRNMVKNHRLAKSIADAAWHQLIQYTMYKAAGAGRRVVLVDPCDTSQQCSRCSRLVPKSLSDRTHVCSHCGLQIHRDLNAARNILALGLQCMGESPRSPGLAPFRRVALRSSALRPRRN